MWENIPLSYYVLAGLLNFITSSALAIVVLFKNPRSRTNQTFSLFAFTVAGWSLCYFLWLRAENSRVAEVCLRTLMVFVIFIPTTFTHFILTFLKADFGKRINFCNYLISCLLGLAAYTRVFASDIGPFLVFPYWMKPRILFSFHAVHFFANTIYSHILMLRTLKRDSGILRNQVLYVFIGTAIGYVAGAINYLTWYRVPIPPFLNPLVSVYVAAISYAIVKYRLMDVNLAVTRTTVFMIVYAVLLGLPLFGALTWQVHLEQALGMRWWVWLWGACALLATAAHYVNLYFQRRAEARLLKEQRRYQGMLLNSAKSMTQIHDLQRLLKLLGYLLVRAMKLEHAGIFLWDSSCDQFVLQVQVQPPCKATNPRLECGTHDALALWLTQERAPVVREEISQLADTKRSRAVSLSRLESRLKHLDAAVVVPSFVNDRMIGFLVLGRKRTGTMYSDDDLNMLQTLANQAALAIENARFYEQEGARQAELFHAQSMGALGRMGEDMSHQINQPLTVISGTAQQQMETWRRLLTQRNELPEEIRKAIERDLASLQSIHEEATAASNIIAPVRGITASNEADRALTLVEVITTTLPIAEYTVPFRKLDFKQELPEGLPKIWGNRPRLAQCLLNLLVNAWDAIKRKQDKLKPPPDYKGMIRLAASTMMEPDPTTKQPTQWVILAISDNGVGLKPEELRQVFIPYYTNKPTTEQLKGYGLHVISQIVQSYGGSISADSTYGMGTTFKIRLPALTDAELARREAAARQRVSGNGL